jgi:hypothetical protein
LNILSDQQVLKEYKEAKRLEPIVMSRRLAEQNNAIYYPFLSHLFKLSDSELRKLSNIDKHNNNDDNGVISSSCSSESEKDKNHRANGKLFKKLEFQNKTIESKTENKQTQESFLYTITRRENSKTTTTTTTTTTKKTVPLEDHDYVVPAVSVDIRKEENEEENPFKAPPNVIFLLERLGLKVKKWIYGDGNCFHRAVSYYLYSTESRHAQIRRKVCEWLDKNWNRYFISKGDKFINQVRIVNVDLQKSKN